jgi:hypothetical protein
MNQTHVFIRKWVSNFILQFMDYTDQAGIKLFAKNVLPAFKKGS